MDKSIDGQCSACQIVATMLFHFFVQLTITVILIPANILKHLVRKMAPSLEFDELRIADDRDMNLSTLDDALGGARSFFLSKFGQVWGTRSGQTQKPLAIDEDTGSPERPTGLRAAIRALAHSIPNLTPKDVLTLLKVGEAAALKDYIDDKQNVMENMIQAAVNDEDGLFGTKITEKFITELWEDLQHPPDNYLAGEFRFRKADGSNNSLLHPSMGAAGQPYARTVKPTSGQPAVLPDPSVLFDILMARRKPKEHPTKISSMLFYLATIIIHDIFRTDHKDFAYSKTSSYLDLAPLYGSNDEELKVMRSFQDGKLKPDCFSETRLLMLPPGSGVLLIMFNRFHNNVATQLAAINENGRFTKPDTTDIKSEAYKKYDEELFQTARLITCGLYVNIILIDYVRTILNLNRTDSDWQLDPRIEVPGGPEMGIGNQVSAEFNLVYRWHATVSQRDDLWTQKKFAELFPGKKIDEINQREFLMTLGHIERDLSQTLPEKRDFEGFNRQENGYYKDEELVASLIGSIDDCSNTYGPRQIPTALKAVEVLGIQQARAWNLATLNEFRKHFSLKPHETFEEITKDPETASNLRHLYKNVDDVELYPGLAVEDAKEEMVPGSGLCPSYTISRAVLSDAVTLVRGDRFYTTSYHPRILTNWGHAEAGFDKEVDKGCVLYRLFQRSFPRHFHPDSIYSHYPFTISKEVRKIFENQLFDRASLYDMSVAQSRPKGKTYTIAAESPAMSVLNDEMSYNLDLSLAIKLLAPSQRNNKSLITALSSHLLHGPSSHLPSLPTNLLPKLCEDFENDLTTHLKSKSYTLTTFSEIDIISSVINRCTLRLAASLFSIPTKSSPTDSSAPITETDLSYLFSTLSGTWTAFDIPTLTAMRQRCRPLAAALRSSLLPALKSTTSSLLKSPSHYDAHASELARYRTDILSALVRALPPTTKPDDLADAAFATVLVLAASLATNVASRFAESLDAALRLDRTHLDRIRAFASDETVNADRGLNAYAHELGRVACTVVTVRQVVKSGGVVTVQGQGEVRLEVGDEVLISSSLVGRDEVAYPSAGEVRLDRDEGAYLPIDLTFGSGDAVWQEVQRGCLRSLFKIVGGLKGLRGARVWDGKSVTSSVKKVPGGLVPQERGVRRINGSSEVTNGVNGEGAVKKDEGKEDEDKVAQYFFLTENWDAFAPVPMSMFICFSSGESRANVIQA